LTRTIALISTSKTVIYLKGLLARNLNRQTASRTKENTCYPTSNHALACEGT
jgi:hypothetical protein